LFINAFEGHLESKEDLKPPGDLADLHSRVAYDHGLLQRKEELLLRRAQADLHVPDLEPVPGETEAVPQKAPGHDDLVAGGSRRAPVPDLIGVRLGQSRNAL